VQTQQHQELGEQGCCKSQLMTAHFNYVLCFSSHNSFLKFEVNEPADGCCHCGCSMGLGRAVLPLPSMPCCNKKAADDLRQNSASKAD
jgi:hypothetical protein